MRTQTLLVVLLAALTSTTAHSAPDAPKPNVELLPVAAYSNERITRTYGNGKQGQILLEQNPPKFTPDVPEYHDMLIKGACDPSGKFSFSNVPAGSYFVIAFIIWEETSGAMPRKTGGGVMKRIQVAPHSQMNVLLEN